MRFGRTTNLAILVLIGAGLTASMASICFAEVAANKTAVSAADANSGAIKAIRAKAEKGDTEAQYNIGEMYYNGQGVPKDYQEAIKWYKKAAENGNVDAQYRLAWMCYIGKDVPQDYDQAAKWFQKAAEKGNTLAQVALGGMYEVGKGVPLNKQQAVMWYQKAAQQGYSEAQYICGLMYFRGVGVSKDYEQAIKWYVKASEQGFFLASLELGRIHEEGKAVPQDYQEAVKWFLRATEQGAGDVGHIKSMYSEGKCELHDYEKAVKLIQTKAEHGDELAQLELAGMYHLGDMGPDRKSLLIAQDYQQAISWYLRLAEQGSACARTAQYLLGTIYSEDVGVPQNYVEAYKWLVLASLGADERLDRFSVEARDKLRLKMSPQQIAEGQRLAREFKPKMGRHITVAEPNH